MNKSRWNIHFSIKIVLVLTIVGKLYFLGGLLLISALVCLISALENRCGDAISSKKSNACSEFLADSKLQFSFLCYNLRSLTCNCSIFSVTNSCNSVIIMLCSPAVL